MIAGLVVGSASQCLWQRHYQTKTLGVVKMFNIDTINENITQSSLPSLQEIAKLSLSERHKLLCPLIQEMAEGVNNDSEINFFFRNRGGRIRKR
jgi:hypothetical protein